MKRLLLLVGALIAVAGAACTLTSCLPRETDRVEAAPFTITYALKGKRRIDRTTFEYVYEGWVTTRGSPVTGVKAEVSSASPDTEVIDRFLMFPGAEVQNATASFDTFAIRQNRNAPFNSPNLMWTVSGLDLPPDPGDAGKTAIEGIDSNADDVRDDLERYIELSIPESGRVRAAARQGATGFQEAIIDGGESGENLSIGAGMMRSKYCIDDMLMPQLSDIYERAARRRQIGLGLERLAANTDGRARRYLDFAASLGGSIDNTQRLGSNGDCDFDHTMLSN